MVRMLGVKLGHGLVYKLAKMKVFVSVGWLVDWLAD